MANKHTKICSMSHVIRETQLKTMMRHHYTPIRMVKIQNTDNTKCWWGWRVIGTLIFCWGGCKMVQPLWKIVWWFLIKLKKKFLQYDSAVAFLGIYLKEMKTYVPTKSCTQNIYSSFIHNWPKLGSNQDALQ